MLLLISLIVAGVITYPFMGGITFKLAERRQLSDDGVIACAIFWPVCLPALLGAVAFDGVGARRKERARQLQEKTQLALRELDLAEKLLNEPRAEK